MSREKRFWPFEVVFVAGLSGAVYWCGCYQLLHLYFSAESGSGLSTARQVTAWIGTILVMAYVRGYALRHATKGLRTGEVSIQDFEPWRRELERDRWVVLAIVLALPSIAVVLLPLWDGTWLLFLLPLVMLIHIRLILRLPDPTHPTNRLSGPPQNE